MRTLLRFLVIAELGGDTLLLSFQFCHLFGDFCKPPVGFITTGIQFQKLIEFRRKLLDPSFHLSEGHCTAP